MKLSSNRARRGRGPAVACAVLGALWILGAPQPAHAQLPAAPSHDIDPAPEAKKYFQIGVSLLQDPDGAQYEAAYKAFRQAYEISPSWKILGNLGLSALKIERDTDAIQAYERYLAAAGDQLDTTEREQIQRDLEVLRNSTATLVLKVKDGSAVSIEDTRLRSVGGPVVNSYDLPASASLTLRLASGHHTLVASNAGKRVTLELDLQSGTNAEKIFDVEAQAAAPTPTAAATPSAAPPPLSPAKSSSSMRTAGYVVGGIGVAALVGGTVTGLLGMSKQSSLNGRCTNKVCSYSSDAEKSSLESDRNALKTYGTATTALLIGGGALAAVGVTLVVIGSPKDDSKVALVTHAGPLGTMLSACGSF